MEDLNSYVITKYANDWYNIGIELKTDVHKLDNINQDNSQQSIVCFEKTLNQWLQSNSDDVTWRTLEIALTNVNRTNLGLKSADVNGKDIFVIVRVNILSHNQTKVLLCNIFVTTPVIYVLYIATSNAIVINRVTSYHTL